SPQDLYHSGDRFLGSAKGNCCNGNPYARRAGYSHRQGTHACQPVLSYPATRAGALSQVGGGAVGPSGQTLMHKFHLGQSVEFNPPRGIYAPRGPYVVTAKLPERESYGRKLVTA